MEAVQDEDDDSQDGCVPTGDVGKTVVGLVVGVPIVVAAYTLLMAVYGGLVLAAVCGGLALAALRRVAHVLYQGGVGALGVVPWARLALGPNTRTG